MATDVGVLLPLGYLASLGLGIGRYVGSDASWLGGVRYVAWLAPGLLAGTAVQSAGAECLWTVYGAVKWAGQYVAQTASPLRPRDAMLGHWTYLVQRMAISAALQLAVMAGFGAWVQPTAPLALVGAVLAGGGSAAWLMAYSVTRKTENFAVVQRFVIVPMFLFAGTFFPVGQLPAGLRYVVYATPLYHGVSLCRGLMLPGTRGTLLMANAAYLVALLATGLTVATRAYARVLAR
jgi:lipooligosaccharide transport system permease protein